MSCAAACLYYRAAVQVARWTPVSCHTLKPQRCMAEVPTSNAGVLTRRPAFEKLAWTNDATLSSSQCFRIGHTLQSCHACVMRQDND